MRAEKFGLGKGITVFVEKFVLIYVDDKDIKEALTVPPMEKVSEILDIFLLSVLGQNTVSYVIVLFVGCRSLCDYLILDLVNIVRVYHSLECSADMFIKFLKGLTAVKSDDIRLGIKDTLLSFGFVNEKTAGQSRRYDSA